MNQADTFKQLLNYRDFFKRLSQITWNVRTSEDRYPLGNLENESSLVVQYANEYQRLVNLLREGVSNNVRQSVE